MEQQVLTQNDVQLKAQMRRLLDYMDGGNAVLGFGYGICSTAGSMVMKEVGIANFVLCKNAQIAVLFKEAFTVSNPTLKVGNASPYPIKLYGHVLAPGKVHANTIVTMVFDGTVFNVIKIVSSALMSTQGAVDLALPSGLLWCEHNVGASLPEEAGLYFSWGNVNGHVAGDGYSFTVANYESSLGHSLGGDIFVGDSYDMAHHNMGGQWRLPRRTELQELMSNCDRENISQDGVNGLRFTSHNNGNSIFFPFSGHRENSIFANLNTMGEYWTSSYYSATLAYKMSFSSNAATNNNEYRRFGMPVRAVM